MPRKAPIHHFSYRSLIIPPILLAAATIVDLFLHSDVNFALLWSQCHSHVRLPGVSRIPGLGTPLCYLISFFRAALHSLRSRAVMGVVLAFIGGLLTVSTVESARICNAPNVLIAYPTGPWLVFDLVGGAVVWELVIIPAFLHRARSVLNAQRDEGGDVHQIFTSRHLPDSELVAIPISVALGYFLPSFLMLFYTTPETIGIWLFFPIYVEIIRQIIRHTISALRRVDPTLVHLASNRWSLLFVYILPLVCSVLAHVSFIWSLTRPDDRKEMTRSIIVFIEVNSQFIFWTVLYWMLVEVGWRVPLTTIITSIVVGPGAGTCVGWIYREKLIHHDNDEDNGDNAQTPDEETPLLQ
ncbi:hypothetical protein H9Q72_006440 [Fusarium xylarioides]|uniref:Uncharacterized protein n=1 Tax=Fusarium xylarioides TaxID=221167 RepID=A0A9P7L9A2_9HYPO|nr:hypothetical protein H9Q70_002231 [Fusarium xylarioides]KAG5765508.1 hypothetical protein H9Q72_006440 [Fusarium xylarioides]KAG5784409.1 hypothetical protein H9Q73_001932 [Fusarium xylarioides]